MKERFISDLGSFVRSLAYSFEAKKGRLDMPPVSCCDMNGCIELFRTIDPQFCAYMLTEMMTGCLRRRLLGLVETPIGEDADLVLDLFLRGTVTTTPSA